MKHLRKNYIPAFTVLELLIGMAVMSIISAMVYVTFTFFSNQVYSYGLQNEEIQTVNRFHNMLKRDLSRASNAEKKQSVLELTSYERQTVKYSFSEHYTVRNNDIAQDTFYVNSGGFKLSTPMVVSDTVVRLEGYFELAGEKIPTHFFKKLGSEKEINEYYTK